ncbi:uncharacterized protein RAG0_14565 [Rhynchosporium agropyri]|uniref:2EXR domain-containing protein n=1 Tax=Rhynchosporium agropyri TaxID=914238 RepID=A0A1E1LHH9_9HELO|nr:uncharacterized protein RAG0_14565 [Rhynchosporium agropyri]
MDIFQDVRRLLRDWGHTFEHVYRNELNTSKQIRESRRFLSKHKTSTILRRKQELEAATETDILFSKFQFLPAEIRLRIWGLTIYTPQIIVLEVLRLGRSKFGYKSVIPHGALSGINSESRFEAKKVQTKIGIAWQSTRARHTTLITTFITNTEIDIIWFQENIAPTSDSLSVALSFEWDRDLEIIPGPIRNIAISSDKWEAVFKISHVAHNVAKFYTHLVALITAGVENISIVVGDNTAHNRRGMQFVAAEGRPSYTREWRNIMEVFQLEDLSTYVELQCAIAAFLAQLYSTLVAAKRNGTKHILRQQFPWMALPLVDMDKAMEGCEDLIIPTFRFVEIRWY